MGEMLTAEQCKRIKELNKKFEPFADKGWMCEGGERNGQPFNLLFNNDTDEEIWASYTGNLIAWELNDTELDEAKEMARIQGEIRRINGN